MFFGHKPELIWLLNRSPSLPWTSPWLPSGKPPSTWRTAILNCIWATSLSCLRPRGSPAWSGTSAVTGWCRGSPHNPSSSPGNMEGKGIRCLQTSLRQFLKRSNKIRCPKNYYSETAFTVLWFNLHFRHDFFLSPHADEVVLAYEDLQKARVWKIAFSKTSFSACKECFFL